MCKLLCEPCAQDVARRMLEVLENYVTHPRARVDAAERMARLIRVVKPISAKPVKCAPWTPKSVLWSGQRSCHCKDIDELAFGWTCN